MAALDEWHARARISLFDEANAILTRAVCAWAGVPLEDGRAGEMTRELSAMIENAGSVGPRMWHALILRNRSERFVRSLVEQVRSGSLQLAEDAPLHLVADTAARTEDCSQQPLPQSRC